MSAIGSVQRKVKQIATDLNGRADAGERKPNKGNVKDKRTDGRRVRKKMRELPVAGQGRIFSNSQWRAGELGSINRRQKTI